MWFEATFMTVAAPEGVWSALVDVESWPQWMTSYTSVRRLDSAPLQVGSVVAVKQPGLGPAKYRVTDFDEGAQFTWVSRAPGVRTRASHVVRPLPQSGTRIVLSVEQSGPLAGVTGRALGRKIRRYLQVEGRGLCAASES